MRDALSLKSLKTTGLDDLCTHARTHAQFVMVTFLRLKIISERRFEGNVFMCMYESTEM